MRNASRRTSLRRAVLVALAGAAVLLPSGVASADPVAITITALSPSGVVYGDAVPAITCSVTSGTLDAGDDLTGSTGATTYTQGAPVSASPFTTTCSAAVITSGLAADNTLNYTITYTPGSLILAQRPITITALSPSGVVYGDAVPAITCSVTMGSFYGTDTFTDSSGSTTYMQGDLVASSPFSTTCDREITIDNQASYAISYTDGSLALAQRPITITALSPSGVVYGNTVPTITCSVTSGTLYTGTDTLTSYTGATTYTQGAPVSASPFTTTCSAAVITSGLAVSTSNYAISYTDGSLALVPLNAGHDATWYTGQLFYYTKSSSSTAVQATLTTSINAPALDCTTGTSVANATVDFVDVLSSEVLAKGVPVSPVGADCKQGTAVAIATLSTGPGAVDSYVISVRLRGSLTGDNNTQFADNPASMTVFVSNPAPSASGIFALGNLAWRPGLSTTDLGTTGQFASAMVGGENTTLTANFTYGKRVTPKGRVVFSFSGDSGSTYFVKSNSINAVSAIVGTGATINTKASITKVLADTTVMPLDGGASLRIDLTTAGRLAGLTLQSSKTSQLLYSNYWVKSGKAWMTTQDALTAITGVASSPSVIVR